MGKFAELYLKEAAPVVEHTDPSVGMIIESSDPADPRPEAGFVHRASSDSSKMGDHHEAKVLRTGKASADHHEVTGPRAHRVAHYVNGKYTGPEHDFHVDSKDAAISHATTHVATAKAASSAAGR